MGKSTVSCINCPLREQGLEGPQLNFVVVRKGKHDEGLIFQSCVGMGNVEHPKITDFVDR